MTADYTTQNHQALQTLKNKHQVEVLKLPEDALQTLKTLSDEVVAEVAGKDKLSQKVYESFIAYRDQVAQWTEISELSYLQSR